MSSQDTAEAGWPSAEKFICWENLHIVCFNDENSIVQSTEPPIYGSCAVYKELSILLYTLNVILR